MITVCGFAIVSALMIAILRHLKPEMAVVASAIAGTVITVYAITTVAPFISFVKGIAEQQGVESYFALMIKATAISFCCKLSSEICQDCGESALASRVELAGKMGIVLISLPIIRQLFEIAKDMLS